MYRTSSHEPRYKHSTRKARHDESREASENSTSDEEEESTESRTEESDDTLGSQGSESIQKGSVFSVESGSYHQRKGYINHNDPGSFITSHVCHSKILKHDKITQKNLLSPFPSFTIPPIYRELAAPVCRGLSGRPTREQQTEARSSARPPKQSPRRKESYEEKDDSLCYIHKTCERADRKAFDKHRTQKDHDPHHSRAHRSERILTCVNASPAMDPAGKCSLEISSTAPMHPPPATPVAARRPKTADRETVTSSKCLEARGRARRKSTTGTSPYILEQTLPAEAIPAKGKRTRKVAGDGSGEVREKLVYVVEEKGKDVAKLETDLFTLNEILTIKKDLVELSEFAKKLKKLKEMKRESETGTNHQNSCHCKPAAELLKDVNRRIEALEARQEELERGSKSEQKGDTETESKKTTNGKKASLESQSKTPIAMKASAMTTIPSFPKMEMFMSRTDNFSNNSDIVNELMDIKTQLHKLEQKRLSKGAPEDPLPPGDLKLPKKEDHAIAVFSSRTYILTDNFDRRKQEMKANEEEKINNYCSTVEGESRKEQTKEHVANWLKSVSPKNQENAYLPPGGGGVGGGGPKRDELSQRGSDRKGELKCKNCSQLLKVDDFQNQEPQKNRATEKDGRAESDLGVADLKRSDLPGKQPMKFKECIVTPSGKIFACVNSSSGRISAESPVPCKPKSPRGPSPPQENERTESSCSIPSALLTRDRVRKMKEDASRRRRHSSELLPLVIKSKSVQDLSGNSSKTEKTVLNTNLKNIGKMAQPKDKKHKDGKNQCLKLLEAHLLALRKTLKRGSTSTSSCSYSEFLASVNLDTATTSDSGRLKGCGDNRTTVVAYTATTKGDDELMVVDRCEPERRRKRMLKEEERRRKRREAECKKILKKKLREQKKCDSAERKRRREQQKCEMKQLKQRCKEIIHCDVKEDCLPKKKSKTSDNSPPSRRSEEDCSPKKSQSSEDLPPKKSRCTEDSPARKSYSSEDSSCKKKHRRQEEQRPKRYCCELTPNTKHHRCEEEHAPRKHRYEDEECVRKYKEEPPRRHYDDEEPPRRRFDREDVPRRYYECEEIPRRHYEKEEPPRRHYDREEVPRRHFDCEEIPRRHYGSQEAPGRQHYDREEPPRRYHDNEDVPRRHYDNEEPPRRYRDNKDAPRRQHYDREEVSRRYHDKEEPPRRRQDTEEPPRRYDDKEEPPRRRQDKEEPPRKHRFEEEQLPRKLVCEQVPRKPPREKRYRQEEYRKSSEEKSTTSQCEKSEDSLQLYRKRYEEQLQKMKYKPAQAPQTAESCKLKNVVKNLGKLKINFPFAGEFCDGKHPKCKKSTTPEMPPEKPVSEKPKPPKKQTERKEREASDDRLQWEFTPSNYEEDDDDDDDDDEDEYKSRSGTYPEHHSRHDADKIWQRSAHAPPDHHQIHQQIHNHDGRLDFPKNCRCVRVYLQSQVQRGWSGLRPFQKISSDTASEVTSSKMGDSSKSVKSNFALPKVKTPVFQVGYACEHSRDDCPKKGKKKKSKKGKCKKEKCKKKHHKKCKSKCKKCKKLDDDRCRCKKCGNVHRKGHHEGGKCEEPPPPPVKPTGSNTRVADKCDADSLPIFSFLTHFCKSKPRDAKTASFMKKLDEVRHLKTCATVKRKPSRRNRWSKSSRSNTCCNEEFACKCKPRLTEIESRLSMLECSKKKKKKKKKKHKCKKCECEYRSMECGEPRSKKECSECQRKTCDECQRKETCGYQKNECSECERQTSDQPKGCSECERKEPRGCSECERKECSQDRGCRDCERKSKKKKKKCCYDECCCRHSDNDECCREKKKKRKKKTKCKCSECEMERAWAPTEKPCGPIPRPCDTAAYYQTIYCPSAADTHNNSTFSVTSKSSTVDERVESTGSTKSKEETPQKKEGLSSLHSFWKNLRKYKIPNGRNGMETLMKKIRRKKSACMLQPGMPLVDECTSPMPRYRQVTELEPRHCGKGKDQREERKKEKKEKRRPEKDKSPSGRERHK